jgi:hypothetical protein
LLEAFVFHVNTFRWLLRLHNLVSAFTAPFAGRLIDLFGSRRVVLPMERINTELALQQAQFGFAPSHRELESWALSHK